MKLSNDYTPVTLSDLENALSQLEELEALKADLDAQIEALKDTFKAYMIEQGSDHIEGESFKAQWNVVKSKRLDSKALKAERPEVYEAFLAESTCTRFTVARKGARAKK